MALVSSTSGAQHSKKEPINSKSNGELTFELNWQCFDTSNNPIESLKESHSEPSRAREVAEDIWRKLPLKLTIKTGSLVRPYISL